MSRAEYERAIKREVEEWPGVSVEIVEGGKHPKAKFKFGGKVLSRPFSGTSSDSAFGVHQMLGDMRRTLRQLGAERSKPDPSREEDEAPYRKPNDGAAKRPPAVKGEPGRVKPDVADQLVSAGVATAEQRTAAQSEGSAKTYETRLAAGGSLGDETDDEDAETDERAERRAQIRALAGAIVDGVYFDLPEEIYHAVPRLSASGLQRLCVSPATFWKGSWLDPEAAEIELDDDATAAQLIGKAYHCARLEPDRFELAFCRKPAKEDFAGQRLITADTGVKAALKALGETQALTSESTIERAQRLVDCGHEGPIWCLIMDEHERERAGRTAIDAKYYDQMVTDMERLRENGEIAELLTGGQAEVSVFWTDHHGLNCKCRFDYLTVRWWVDLKTFDNSRGKVLEQALADAVRYNRYYVGAVHYRDGAEAIRTESLPIIGDANDDQRALIAQIQIKPKELECHYVFQEKGGIPNLLAREFPFYDVPLVVTSEWDTGASEEAQAKGHEATRQRTGLFARGSVDIMHAKDQFVLYSNAYEPGRPWFPLNARGRFSDLDFSPHWIEGKI